MSDLLNEFTSAVESTEITLLVAVCACAVSMAVTIISVLMIWVLPPRDTEIVRAMYWIASFSSVLFIGTLIYLLEPRPLHWLPSSETIREAGSFRLSEWRWRIQRWWRWRRQYETKTKLNV